jgi:hypothetical protein
VICHIQTIIKAALPVASSLTKDRPAETLIFSNIPFGAFVELLWYILGRCF